MPQVCTLPDFIGKRYGPVARTLVVCISLFNMSIAMLAEYIVVGRVPLGACEALCGGEGADEGACVFLGGTGARGSVGCWRSKLWWVAYPRAHVGACGNLCGVGGAPCWQNLS